MKILVVEDDPPVREALERALGFEGYEVDTARDGGIALSMVRSDAYDLVLLDVMMPHVDGIETCKRIRASGDTIPILMLTAKTAVDDRVEGLDAGADDYLTKPFALEELLARLRALLRRAQHDVSDVLSGAGLEMNLGTREVKRGDRSLDLTKTEFDMLESLMRDPGKVVSRNRLYEEVWGIDFETSSNSLDVYVGYIRRKTEAGDQARVIHTVRGVGYVLREDR